MIYCKWLFVYFGLWITREEPPEMEGSGMLVLSREEQESIVIGENIIVTVTRIIGDKVRLGVEAPKEVPVHRREVYDAIRREAAADEKKAAGGAATDDENDKG